MNAGDGGAKQARQFVNESVSGRRQSAAVLAALGLARDCIGHDSLDDFFKVPGGTTISGHGLDCKDRVLFAAFVVVAPVLRWGVIPIVCHAGAWTAAFYRNEWQTLEGRPEPAAEFVGCPISGFKVWPNNVGGHHSCCRPVCHEPFAGLDDISGRYRVHRYPSCLDGTMSGPAFRLICGHRTLV